MAEEKKSDWSVSPVLSQLYSPAIGSPLSSVLTNSLPKSPPHSSAADLGFLAPSFRDEPEDFSGPPLTSKDKYILTLKDLLLEINFYVQYFSITLQHIKRNWFFTLLNKRSIISDFNIIYLIQYMYFYFLFHSLVYWLYCVLCHIGKYSAM